MDRQREDTAILCEVKGWQVAGVYIDNDRCASNGKGPPRMGAAAGRHRGREDRRGSRLGPGPGQPHDGRLRSATRSCSSQRGILLATSNNGDIDLSHAVGCADGDDQDRCRPSTRWR